MKGHVICTKCTMDAAAQHPSDEAGQLNPPLETPIYKLPLTGEIVYNYTCPKGHANTVVGQHYSFEVLVEGGIQAFIDGYYRESIVDFSSAMERIHENYVKALWASNMGADFSEFDKSWNLMAVQSERQYGAFVDAYFRSNLTAPPTIPEVKFRNDVVHKGKIPTKLETLKYIEQCSSYLRSIFENGKKTNDDGWKKLRTYLVSKAILGVSDVTYTYGLLVNAFSRMEQHSVSEVIARKIYFDTTPINERVEDGWEKHLP